VCSQLPTGLERRPAQGWSAETDVGNLAQAIGTQKHFRFNALSRDMKAYSRQDEDEHPLRLPWRKGIDRMTRIGRLT
jgi:hypothetical protein